MKCIVLKLFSHKPFNPEYLQNYNLSLYRINHLKTVP
jgi:hypothetical protein